VTCQCSEEIVVSFEQSFFFPFLFRHDIERVKSHKILLTGDLSGLKEVRAKKEQIRGQCRSNLDTLQVRKIALEDELNHVSHRLL
jgi:hypothetical protein